jgi:hypothetical protein
MSTFCSLFVTNMIRLNMGEKAPGGEQNGGDELDYG